MTMYLLAGLELALYLVLPCRTVSDEWGRPNLNRRLECTCQASAGPAIFDMLVTKQRSLLCFNFGQDRRRIMCISDATYDNKIYKDNTSHAQHNDFRDGDNFREGRAHKRRGNENTVP